MNKKVLHITEDGSHTIVISEMNVAYHSKYGAIQESMHVFIKTGLLYFIDKHKHLFNQTIKIFEVGFGTGLNAFLSLHEAVKLNQKIMYQTIEPSPLSIAEIKQLNYPSLINKNLEKSFIAMHDCAWNKVAALHPLFSFQKIKTGLPEFETEEKFHIIYFDAFDPNAQPELWTETVFKNMFHLLKTDGILVTYCSKGIVRRAMQAAGFSIEKLKGPKGKREIVRVEKSTPH
jgi:tRNA U34 5-methylaminomethyl-2-thiouridine-forming methyltransferase MnmC